MMCSWLFYEISISYSFLLDAFVHWFASDRNWFVAGNATKEIRGECSRCDRRKLGTFDITNEEWGLCLILRRKSEAFWVIVFFKFFLKWAWSCINCQSLGLAEDRLQSPASCPRLWVPTLLLKILRLIVWGSCSYQCASELVHKAGQWQGWFQLRWLHWWSQVPW